MCSLAHSYFLLIVMRIEFLNSAMGIPDCGVQKRVVQLRSLRARGNVGRIGEKGGGGQQSKDLEFWKFGAYWIQNHARYGIHSCDFFRHTLLSIITLDGKRERLEQVKKKKVELFHDAILRNSTSDVKKVKSAESASLKQNGYLIGKKCPPLSMPYWKGIILDRGRHFNNRLLVISLLFSRKPGYTGP